MEFLDINITKDSSLSLHPILSPFYWRILRKTILYSCFNIPYKKIRETRKLESVHKEHVSNGKARVESQTKTRVREDSSLCPETSTKNGVQEFHL